MTTPPTAPQPAPRPRWKKLTAQLVPMLVGGAFGAAAVLLLEAAGFEAPLRQAREQLGRGGVAALLLGTLLFGFWLAIALHEVGHLLGGRLARFRFLLFTAGPLRVERNGLDAPLRAGLNREFNVLGGLVVLVPTEYHALRQRLALFVAGGPLMNLLLAGLAGLGFVLAQPPAARVVLAVLALLSGFLFLLSATPLRAGGLVSDGGRLLRLLRQDEESRREAALFPLGGMLFTGVTPGQWPAELVAAALDPANGSTEECSARLLAFYHELDRGEVEAAGRHLDRVLALIGTVAPGLAPAYHVEIAYFEALYRRDPGRAREHLARVPQKSFVVKPYERYRAEAALALAEGDAAAASAHLERAAADIPRHGTFTRAQLQVMRRMLEAAPAQAGDALRA